MDEIDKTLSTMFPDADPKKILVLLELSFRQRESDQWDKYATMCYTSIIIDLISGSDSTMKS
jgi:hypothetical protein